jgi:hypothetical protein
LFSFLSHSLVSLSLSSLPQPQPTALRRRRSTHRTTLSTSIPHHSTTGSMPFNHYTHDVDPPTARATEPPISTDQDRSTEKRAQLKPIKTPAESTSSFTSIDPSTGRHPSSIHGRSGLILPIKTPVESTSCFTGVDPSTGRHPSSIHGRLWLILLLPLLDEGRRGIGEGEREREIINKKKSKHMNSELIANVDYSLFIYLEKWLK